MRFLYEVILEVPPEEAEAVDQVMRDLAVNDVFGGAIDIALDLHDITDTEVTSIECLTE